MEPLNDDPTGTFTDANRPLYEVKANLFKGLAHPVRVRVLEVLAHADTDLSVSDLLADTGLEASHLSQHLSVLRRHNLVVAERRGSLVFYGLAYPQVADLLAVARQLLVEILETTQQRLISTVGRPRLGSTDAASNAAVSSDAVSR
ncbi:MULTISPECIES: ArsR/SmtB family transcription factor [Cryobacterium]|uniref:Transcriptional regulator n=1 Tax=Cryobacterium zongtaii TaxID=1259217 RepID=A0A2S3ZHQ5_9MICO|nr:MULTISPECIES: metalloregulator ArsR/SmtB family transcription factor [Cryobacterium]ASD20749.1 transcriptional regulator [Cryobacterium sp. LW097]POH66953.1 transcriptional regulator [Cryobacterium zongtaii]POH67160.1 transcriptional regulator [Cryobacterium zongtaii]TFC43931.1 transcriptional regulator [Cryobacterium sp. TMN-39-2]TFC50559.1 transcriptional regulator [Cryobacterium sp. TMB3-1-2]